MAQATPTTGSANGIGNVHHDASVVLLGMPGSGKSTLAVMLSVAFNWPIREAAQYLRAKFGLPAEAYKKQVGPELYQIQVKDALQTLLGENASQCVIVCDAAAVQGGASVLRQYMKAHLIIHVERDLEGIAENVRSWDSNKLQQLQHLVNPLFRSCSNFEYYNLSETGSDSAQPISHLLASSMRSNSQTAQVAVPSISLKSVERDFMKFACSIRGVENSKTWDISSPIAATRTEKRTYTYAVSISLDRIRHAEIEDVATAADAFEIVIDSHSGASQEKLAQISLAYTRVRRRTTIPVVLHVKRHGKDQQNHSIYLQLLDHCLRLSPDYVTIDLGCSRSTLTRLIARKRNSHIIGHLNLSKHKIKSWHDSSCLDVYNMAKGLGFDVVRLCLTPKSMLDNFAIQSFRNYIDLLPPPNPPLIAYNTGLLGRTSLCLNSAMTPVMAVGHDSHLQDDEAPCITANESTASLFGIYVHVPLEFSFVAADVGYTLSPTMHEAAFKAFGIPHTYRAVQCQSMADLEEITKNSSFGGMSLGPPFKAEALNTVQSLSPEAEAIGAINTIIPARRRVLSDTSKKITDRHLGAFDGSDHLHGENTDWIGVAICILRGLSPVNVVRARTSALVIGAGSMARAAIYSLLSLGVQNLILYNRTRQHADDLVAHYKQLDTDALQHDTITREFISQLRIQVITSMEEPLPDDFSAPTIIISCVPFIEGFTLPPHWLTSVTGGLVLELGYESLTTSLVDQIWSLSHKSWIILRGLDFLPEQGCPQFEMFTGRRAPRRLMRNEVLTAYRQRHLGESSEQGPA